MIATDKHSGHRFELHNPVRTAEHIVSDYTNLTTGNRSNQGYFRYDWYDFEPKQAAPQEPPIYRVAFSGNSIGEQEVIADDPRQAVAAVMSGSHAPDAWYRVEAPDGNTTWWRPVRIANDWPADYHGPDAKYAVIPR